MGGIVQFSFPWAGFSSCMPWAHSLGRVNERNTDEHAKHKNVGVWEHCGNITIMWCKAIPLRITVDPNEYTSLMAYLRVNLRRIALLRGNSTVFVWIWKSKRGDLRGGMSGNPREQHQTLFTVQRVSFPAQDIIALQHMLIISVYINRIKLHI